MAAGGATWAAAGLLEVDAANPFTVADGTAPYRPGWWKFTATARKSVTLNLNDSTFTGSTKVLILTVYSGTEDPASASFVKTGPNGFVHFFTQPGVTYRVRARPADVDDVNTVLTYGVNYEPTDPFRAVTAWNDALQEQANQLTISAGDLLAENTSEFTTPPDWFSDVVPTGLARRGNYFAIQVLGGQHCSLGEACCWDHARHGDLGDQLWNGSTTDPEDTSVGVCVPMQSGDATGTGTTVSYQNLPHEGTVFDEGFHEADITMQARGLWALHVRDNLAERGTQSIAGLDPLADGVPADVVASGNYELEYEGPLELLSIEATGDIASRPAEGTVIEAVTFMFRRLAGPGWEDGDWTPWTKEFPEIWNGERSDLKFQYLDGLPVWHEVDGVVSGDSGWEGLSDPVAGEAPDEVFIYGMASAFGAPPTALSRSSSKTLAFRFTFRSPRYRWVYEGGGPAPIRTLQRTRDGLVGSGTQTLHRGSVQRSLRTIGGTK